MHRSIKRTLLIAWVAFAAASSGQARDIYVALDGTGTLPQHGYDWATAFSDLPYVMANIARTNSTVYIKGGTWYLTNQLAFRAMNVTIIGGYSGDGTPGSNNPLIWPTVFSRNPDTTVTNRIMIASVTSCVLQNLTLCDGVATTNNQYHPIPTAPDTYGGGLNITGTRDLTLVNCTIVSNTATDRGGGIFINTNSSLITLTNCVIGANTVNSATPGVYGAGIYLFTNDLIVANTLFWGNKTATAGPQGLALYSLYGRVAMNNVTVARHYSEGIRRGTASASITVSNSILWDYGTSLNNVPATNVFYSCVRNGEGIYTNLGCIFSNPVFVDYENNNFQVQSMQGHWTADMGWVEDYTNSPSIDAGDPASAYFNENMPNGGRINLGAYGNTERASRTLSPPIMIVSTRLVSTNTTMTNYVLLGQTATNQPFYIWNSNGYSRDLFFTNVSDAAWITPVPAIGTHTLSNDPAVIQNTYNTAGLALGVHTGRVTVTGIDSRGNVCSNSPSVVRAVMHVLTAPTLALHPTNLVRSVVYGSNAPSQSFEVWNATDTRFGLEYAASVSAAWLAVTPNSGSSYGEHDTLTVSYNVAGLGPGIHTATIAVHAAVTEYPWVAVSNAPQYIRVTVTVTRAPGLAVQPMGLSNSVTIGHTAPLKTLEVWNSSKEPRRSMSYATWTDKPWVSSDPSSGSSTGEHDTINLWFTTTNLVSGIYTARVTVAAGYWSGGTFIPSGEATNTPRIVPMILTVNTLPEIGASPRGFTNYITLGGNAPNQTFQLWNGSDAPKGGLAYTITNDSAWFSASPATGTTTGEADTITVVYNTAAMANGTYHGVMTVRATDPSTGVDLGSANLDISLMIRPLPVLALTPSSFTQTILQNSTGGSSTFELWNGSATPRAMMNYVITWDQPWLSVSPASGFSAGAPNTSTIAFNAAGLAPGIHTAVITVIAWDESTGQTVFGSPRNIPVTIQVLPRTPANPEAPSISGLPYIGQRLAAQPGLWTPPGTVAFTTQWQRADTAGGQSLADIPGATLTNYIVQRADAGKYLRAKVTAVEHSAEPALTNVAYSPFVDPFKIRAAKYDFDTDGRADAWFYDQPSGVWRFFYSGTHSNSITSFGWSEAVGVPGDYDGDGRQDVGVYYQAGGLWYILTARGEFRVEHFGWWETGPVPADYDGDGATDLAVYYPPTGAWYILTATRQFILANFGFTGATPVPGDFDGDRAADLALYHQAAGTWYVATLPGAVLAWGYNFGWYGAVPVPGDYTGDGVMDLAVYDPAANLWYFLINNQLLVGTFGTSNGACIPLSADYDGDGVWDVATVHASGTHLVWCIFQTSAGYIGVTYDTATGRWR